GEVAGILDDIRQRRHRQSFRILQLLQLVLVGVGASRVLQHVADAGQQEQGDDDGHQQLYQRHPALAEPAARGAHAMFGGCHGWTYRTYWLFWKVAPAAPVFCDALKFTMFSVHWMVIVHDNGGGPLGQSMVACGLGRIWLRALPHLCRSAAASVVGAHGGICDVDAWVQSSPLPPASVVGAVTAAG